MERTLNDLVSLAQQVDPSNASGDFRQKKTFNYYDPYNSNNTVGAHPLQFANIKFEDDIKGRASITVDVHTNSLEELTKSKNLSFTDRERLE